MLTVQQTKAIINPAKTAEIFAGAVTGNKKGSTAEAKKTCPKFAKIPETTLPRSSVNSNFLIL